MIKKMNEDEKAKVRLGQVNQSGELSARRFLLPYGFAALVLERGRPNTHPGTHCSQHQYCWCVAVAVLLV